MAGERIQEAIHPLLKQLAKARCLTARYGKIDDSSTVVDADELIAKIGGEIKLIKDFFIRLERWERQVMDEIGDIAKHLDSALEDSSCRDEFQSQLQTVSLKVSGLRERHTPTLQQPLAFEMSQTVVMSSPAEAKAKPVPVVEVRFMPSQTEVGHEIAVEGERPAQLPLSGSDAIDVGALVERYEKLSLPMKDCLVSFSILPEDSVIKKRLLIYWWIGEGLVTATRTSTAEEVGEGCITELAGQGFITPIYRDHHLVIDGCKVHPLIRQYSKTRAHRTNYCRHGHDFLYNSPSKYLLENASHGMEPVRYHFKDLTCFNLNRRSLKFKKRRFMAMRYAPVLQLGRWQTSPKHHIEVESTEFLEWLASFKILRYLSLQGISRISVLPASIGEITNLRILNLRACHNLETLPVEVTMLRRLTHLDASECYLLDHMPVGLGSLSELEVLKGFVIGSSRSQDPCRLSELSKLKKLRKLSISIGSDSVVAEGEFNALSQFEALRSLTITWGIILSPSYQGKKRLSRVVTMTTMLVSPPPNIEKLDLQCYPRSLSPDWLHPSKMRSLKRLYIRGGKLEKLGSGPNVRWNVNILRLRFLSELDLEEEVLLNAFPHLSYLEIHGCNRLRNTARKIRHTYENELIGM